MTCPRFYVFFLLVSVAFVVGIAGDCHGQEGEYAKIRYLPEQREQLKEFLYETTPTLNWGMDDEFLYSGIKGTTATLYAGMFSLGPDRLKYTDFLSFLASASVADRGYEGRKARAEGSIVFGGFPREDKNLVLYVDFEPYFSRVYREVRAKQEAALEHFAEVHRFMPNVGALIICFREEDVIPCFPLLEEIRPESESKGWQPRVGFRIADGYPDTGPVWVEKWEGYYLVWRTRTLEGLAL